MDTAARELVVRALTALGASGDVLDRGDAGEAAARFLDVPWAATLALRLVLDPQDTYPTLKVSAALARRADRAGWRVIAQAISAADSTQIEWIGSAVGDSVRLHARDRDAALALCADLVQDDDQDVRSGAAELATWLAEIAPILNPS